MVYVWIFPRTDELSRNETDADHDDDDDESFCTTTERVSATSFAPLLSPLDVDG